LELQRWKLDEQRKLEDARFSEETALAVAEKEKAKCKVAMDAAEASRKIAELEAQKRANAEMKSHSDSDQRKKTGGGGGGSGDSFLHGSARYRRYTIEEIEEATNYFSNSLKIGEGGYGPVYRAELDHTPVAIKVLKPDAAQGRSQFQQEVCKMAMKSLTHAHDMYSVFLLKLFVSC
jgi:nucleoredoxin